MFDLNGFKDYNDAFGHSAGDVLLARLGHALRDAVHGHGEAYRLSGDEFCASYGAVLIPGETGDVTEAMQLVDQRMYARKAAGRRSADRQTKGVLLTALYERHPELSTRFRAVADLADAVSERMGMPVEQRAIVRRPPSCTTSAKVAIPDEILDKDSPLSAEEWAFVRRHSSIGERILGAAPSLSFAARLVRSTNEWFDGTGYPDRLAGEAIPLGSRIIAVSDAFVAMTSARSYAPAMTVVHAISELRGCAGTQFDPQVVAVFVSVLTDVEARGQPVRGDRPRLLGLARRATLRQLA